MRSGFTTGSCAAAASKAAAFMLLGKVEKKDISIITPAGITYNPMVEDIVMAEDYVSCGIKKDAGDDPDSTNGILICSKVEFIDSTEIVICGGKGVGVVTRTGLEQRVGQVAINSVPRQMIIKEVSEVRDFFDYKGGFKVTIFVPEGEMIAKKTFNPHMGIEGGISILGTSGIVEPMSRDALIKTIELDLRQKKSEGNSTAILVPGNYGENFLKNKYGIDPRTIVHFSNYIGKAIDLAVEIGFENILIVGHTGKLVKVSGGIMNTHSKEADCRLELMVSATIMAYRNRQRLIPDNLLCDILEETTTSGAIELLDRNGMLYDTSKVIVDRILYHLNKRADNKINIECILYENSYGLLAKSDHAEDLL